MQLNKHVWLCSVVTDIAMGVAWCFSQFVSEKLVIKQFGGYRDPCICFLWILTKCMCEGAVMCCQLKQIEMVKGMIQSNKRSRWLQLRQDSLPAAAGELGEMIHVLIPSLAKVLSWCVGKEAAWACVGSRCLKERLCACYWIWAKRQGFRFLTPGAPGPTEELVPSLLSSPTRN